MRPSRSALVTGFTAAAALAVFLAALKWALGALGYDESPWIGRPDVRPLELAGILAVAALGHVVGLLAWRADLRRAARRAQRVLELGDPRGYRLPPWSSWRLLHEAAVRARLYAALERRVALGVALSLPIFFVGLSRVVVAFHPTTYPNRLDFELDFALAVGVALSHAAATLGALVRIERAVRPVIPG